MVGLDPAIMRHVDRIAESLGVGSPRYATCRVSPGGGELEPLGCPGRGERSSIGTGAECASRGGSQGAGDPHPLERNHGRRDKKGIIGREPSALRAVPEPGAGV